VASVTDQEPRFGVLGPVVARSAGAVVSPGPPKQRLLLALLLCQVGEIVSTDLLQDALWDGAPPPSARANLRGYVHGLRAVVGSDALVGHGHPGYALTIEPDQIDSHRFVALSERGTAAVDVGDLRAGRDDLARALALWRGCPYADVAEVPVLLADAQRLQDRRLTAVEHRLEADLRLGRAEYLVPELTELVAAHPYRERFHSQLMRALYRCGRQVDALAVYRHAYRLLTDELGVEPQAELQRLHEAMVRGDPEPAGQDGGRITAVDPAGRPVPAQLPAEAASCFSGRTGELATLTAALSGQSESRMRVAALVGAGGIGKTWLAVHWASTHRDRFPDGQLFADLRGFDPSGDPVPPAAVIRDFLDALGVPGSALPADLDAQVALYRSLLADKRMLIVLDNARDGDQVLPLLPGSASCAVIVTSRDRLTGLVTRHGARALPVDVLDQRRSHDVLVRRLGRHRTAAEPEAVTRLVAACGGLPLALGIAAARAEVAPQLALAAIADELADAATRLEALNAGDEPASLSAVLSWSYAALPAGPARLFAALGLIAGPDVSVTAAAAVAGSPPAEVRAGLRALHRQSLISPYDGGRWRMHDLVRLYAAEQAVRVVAEPERRRARRRYVDWLLHTAYAADRLLNPNRTPVDIGRPAAGTPVTPLPDEAAAVAWLETEHSCLLAAQRLAADLGRHAAVWQLAWALSSFHRRSGRSQDELAAWRIGLPAAERSGDPAARATAHRSLGEAYGLVGRHRDAVEHLRHALALAESAGDVESQARGHRAFAFAMARLGDHEPALIHAGHALRLYRSLAMPDREADALGMVGELSYRLGRHTAARASLEKALVLCRAHGLRLTEAATVDSLGEVLLAAGEPAGAVDCFRRALALVADLSHAYLESHAFEHLGDAHAALGQPQRAVEAWRRAADLYAAQDRRADADRVRGRIRDAAVHRSAATA